MRYFDNIDLKGSLSKEEIKFQLQNGSDRILTDFQLFGGDNVLKHHKGWLNYVETNNPKIKKVALRVYYAEGFWLRLDLFAAESMHSAKLTYYDMNLGVAGNVIKTRIYYQFPIYICHFKARTSFIFNGYLDSKQYLNYWRDNVDDLHSFFRDEELDSYIYNLCNDGLVTESDFERYIKLMNSVKYKKLNVCPGFGIFYKWSIKDIIEMDKNDVLIN
jgi:hypothetical protein